MRVVERPAPRLAHLAVADRDARLGRELLQPVAERLQLGDGVFGTNTWQRAPLL